MPGSCSSGFRSRPSSAAGIRRSNGFEVRSMKGRNPALTRPLTPSTRATKRSGRPRLNTATAKVQPASIHVHSSIEPSCEPQVAAKRYCAGRREFEWLATLSTEKSLPTKEAASAAKAASTNTNWPTATGRAVASSAARPLAAPTKQRVPCASARQSATMRAKCPSSGITLAALLPGEGGLVDRMARLAQRIRGFRRHVVLVVLGEHLARLEDAVGTEPALRHHALAFAKQVGKDADVDDRNRLRGVGHAKAHGEPVLLARDAPRLDQPAQAKSAIARYLVRGDLRGSKEEDEVRAQRVQHQCRGHAQPGQCRDDPERPLSPRLQCPSPPRSCAMPARGAPEARRSRRSARSP